MSSSTGGVNATDAHTRMRRTFEDCQLLDATDKLRHFRERFSLPKDTVYLDGNSLGPLPVATPARVAEVRRTYTLLPEMCSCIECTQLSVSVSRDHL